MTKNEKHFSILSVIVFPNRLFSCGIREVRIKYSLEIEKKKKNDTPKLNLQGGTN